MFLLWPELFLFEVSWLTYEFLPLNIHSNSCWERLRGTATSYPSGGGQHFILGSIGGGDNSKPSSEILHFFSRILSLQKLGGFPPVHALWCPPTSTTIAQTRWLTPLFQVIAILGRGNGFDERKFDDVGGDSSYVSPTRGGGAFHVARGEGRHVRIVRRGGRPRAYRENKNDTEEGGGASLILSSASRRGGKQGFGGTTHCSPL